MLEKLNKFEIDKNEKRLYCSGIDPSIVQLDYITVKESEDYKSWVKSSVFCQHSHDVRSLLVANRNVLISAGVDTKIIFKSIKEKPTNTLRKYNSMPQVSQIQSFQLELLLEFVDLIEISCGHV